MKIRTVFPALLTSQSTLFFSAVWAELTNALPTYQEFYINGDRQGRLEDGEGMPYSLDFLVLEELDLIQALLKAPPVKAELQQQLQSQGDGSTASSWLPEIMKLASSYAQITTEDAGLWEIDVNIFLSEETSITPNYTPRTCSGDLAVKTGEWLKDTAAEGLLTYMNSLFADSSVSWVFSRSVASNSQANNTTRWQSREAALYILNRVLRDFGEVDQEISPNLASQFTQFVHYATQQEQELLRARGYLVAGSLSKVAGEAFHSTTTSHLKATLQAIAADPTEVVKVACIRALQDLISSLPTNLAQPFQPVVISSIAEFFDAHDLREQTDADDLKVGLAETLRDTVMADSSIVLSSNAIDVLFKIASTGADNFHLKLTVVEAFEDIVDQVSDLGQEPHMRLCEKVLPSLIGVIDVGNLTNEESLTTLAVDLLRALTERSPEQMPAGFVETVMPKLNRLLLGSDEAELIRPATEAVRNMLSHDFAQFIVWRDPESGKEALEVVLIIIDRLLGPAVDDNAATDVGQLAAELVEKAGSERLGPYLPQLLQAVAQRLATAQKAQFIQSLILVFARLTLISAREVVDFLAQLNLNGQSGLTVVLSKWLENSVNFAGYDEVKQNIFALVRLYELADPRVADVPVKGDLIINDTGRIKTRSQSRNNPDQFTTIPAPIKIIKVLVEELGAASGNKEIDASALEDIDSDDGDDDWEDDLGQTLDLGLGATKQGLMSWGAGGSESVFGVRRRDDETQDYLANFFRQASTQPGFQELYASLSPDEQGKLQSL